MSSTDNIPARKGGTATALKHLTIWCLIMSVFLMIIYFKEWAVGKKQNYTTLHDTVNNLVIRVEKLEGK